MSLNLGESNTQIAFHDKLDALQFHLVNVDIEAIICICLFLRIDDLLSSADQSQDALNQAELERQKFRCHLLVVQKSGHLEKFESLLTLIAITAIYHLLRKIRHLRIEGARWQFCLLLIF